MKQNPDAVLVLPIVHIRDLMMELVRCINEFNEVADKEQQQEATFCLPLRKFYHPEINKHFGAGMTFELLFEPPGGEATHRVVLPDGETTVDFKHISHGKDEDS